jgi:hypothetical protein
MVGAAGSIRGARPVRCADATCSAALSATTAVSALGMDLGSEDEAPSAARCQASDAAATSIACAGVSACQPPAFAAATANGSP